MKINNIGYLLKEGIRGIFLHGFMSFAAVCVTVACLIMIGSFSALLYNLNVIVEREAKDAELLAIIDETYSEAQAKSVGSKINMIENVDQAKFVTRQEAFDKFTEDKGNAFRGVDVQRLRDRFEIILVDNDQMKETMDEIAKIPGVADVEAPLELASNFSALQYLLRTVSAAIIALLLVVSLLIISNTIKLAMYDRKDEIGIMKMVGATNSFIRLPFVVEGLLLGIFGAALAFFLEWGIYNGLIHWIGDFESLSVLIRLVPFETLLWPMVGIFSAAGIFVGLFGSVASIRKFLDV